ncbi:MAG: 3-hydroxyacyl-CoA dehydrogenase family protein, partial [Planctomycetota bacterium]
QAAAELPERGVGLHFFNPVPRMPLVEVVAGERTAPWAVSRAIGLAQALGKYPVVVQDSPGFVVNRLLMPYLDAAVRLLEEGGPRLRAADGAPAPHR